MDQYGHGRGTTQGGFSEYSIVKAKYCYQLQHNITPNEAALLEPMGNFEFCHWICTILTFSYFIKILIIIRIWNWYISSFEKIVGVAYNGVDQIQVEGKEVLVIGCGAIGLFAIAVARAKGIDSWK